MTIRDKKTIELYFNIFLFIFSVLVSFFLLSCRTNTVIGEIGEEKVNSKKTNVSAVRENIINTEAISKLIIVGGEKELPVFSIK